MATVLQGTLTDAEICKEAQGIAGMLIMYARELDMVEKEFVEKMESCHRCSMKQLAWLNRIKVKRMKGVIFHENT